MNKNVCLNCGDKVKAVDIFMAGLPSLISCGNCKQKIMFDFKPIAEYPIVLLFIALTVFVGVKVGGAVIESDFLPFSDAKVSFGVFLIFAVLLELILTFWILNFKHVIPDVRENSEPNTAECENKQDVSISPAPQELIDSAKQKSDLFAQLFSAEAGFALNYSYDSVSFLDHVTKLDWVVDGEVDKFTILFGSFLGEAIINQYGGDWVIVNGQQAIQINMEFYTFPYDKIYRSIKGGASEKIIEYFQSIETYLE